MRKKTKRVLVTRTRNLNTLTESAYWSMIRSALRQATRYWKPLTAAKMASRRKYIGPNKLQKWEYCCSQCNQWFLAKNIQMDHVVPVGSLRCLEDLPGFVERLTCEDVNGFRPVCKPCHQAITNSERRKK